jgi:hypothetical protein
LIRSTARWAFAHEREPRALLASSLVAESQQRGSTRKRLIQRDRWIADLLADISLDTPDENRPTSTATSTGPGPQTA